MLENYTNEHSADMQSDMDFLIEQRQEVANIIAKNLGEDMGLLAQSNFLSLFLFCGGALIGMKNPDMPVSEIKEFVAGSRLQLHRLVQVTMNSELKEFEENCDDYMQIFEHGIYCGQFGEEEEVGRVDIGRE